MAGFFSKIFNFPSEVDPTIGFPVDKVEKAKNPLPTTEWSKVVSGYMGLDVPEAHSKPKEGMSVVDNGHVYVTHGFVAAVHLAYAKHYPLVITPDDIWLCIAQGFSAHVNANAEKLRHHFVEHEGKKEVTVRRDDFVKGSSSNPWPEAFAEFSLEIRGHIGEKIHDLLVPTFTTTGPTEKAAAEIVLMDTFKAYFDYRMMTMCGIPEVILKGTVEDWKQLREKALSLGQFELEWWTKCQLKPVLDELVATSEGHVNKRFWSSIYKLSNGSGGPFISGWITSLFPYIGHDKLNERNENRETLTSDLLPSGISAVPFIWQYFNEEIPMKFFAGFMGAVQDPNTLYISSPIGWAVARDILQSVKSNGE